MRKTYLDYLKAFSIVLVVVGHSLSYYGENFSPLSPAWTGVNTLIYAVHVPLFFVIAGYLCHPQPLGNYYKKKLLRVFVPYCCFSAAKGFGVLLLSHSLTDPAAVRGQLYSIFVMGQKYWFCVSILFLYAAAPLLWEREKRPALRLVTLGAFLGILGANTFFSLRGALASAGGPFLTDRWQLRRTFQYAPFFLGGMVLRQWEDALAPWVKKHVRALTWLSAAAALLGLAVAGGTPVGTTILAKYLVGTPSMFLLYLAARRLPEGLQVFSGLGRCSLQLMLLDSFYKVALFSIAARLLPVNVWTALGVAACNLAAGRVTCAIAERIPLLNTAMGLRAPRTRDEKVE